MTFSQLSELVEILIMLSTHFTAVELSETSLGYIIILNERPLKFLWTSVYYVANAAVSCNYKWRRANGISLNPERVSTVMCTSVIRASEKDRGNRSKNDAISVLTVWHSERAARCRGAGRRSTKYRAWLMGNAGTRHLPPAGDLKARNRERPCNVDNLI